MAYLYTSPSSRITGLPILDQRDVVHNINFVYAECLHYIYMYKSINSNAASYFFLVQLIRLCLNNMALVLGINGSGECALNM